MTPSITSTTSSTVATTATTSTTGPRLVEPRGTLSAAVTDALRSHGAPAYRPGAVLTADPWGEDLQLALYLLYELHYRGFDGVDDDREWDPELLRLRQAMEARFLHALSTELSDAPRSVAEAFAPLLVEPLDSVGGLSRHLERKGELWQVREYAALRSLYHLKEADPHVWVIPRLRGRAKAAMAAIEYDEFGAGRPDRIHAQLFADLMEDLGLDPAYGRYLDQAPAPLLATVNLMSLFGLHRSHRGFLVGHFACVEVTSSPGSRRLAKAMRRCGAGPAAEHFYAEHVEADAVHEQVVRREVIGGLLADEPSLEADIAFGCAATVHLEDRLAEHIGAAWGEGRSALRTPLSARTREGAE
ncbi:MULTISPECIES: iron-containing redox enzyme family protein [unclassified Streptomyces]|uniref:iron-containing redox enzyme family protein n=1 Tax=unclassified Streptomyces TaxID=2593676 RepID=UPI001655E086|nr:iron-containing redox enzyme family protein [Streptomyces sp. CB02980]MCB8901098.1 iron-containing redox enzyme family protein [Streptomyces sp. CB02980]